MKTIIIQEPIVLECENNRGKEAYKIKFMINDTLVHEYTRTEKLNDNDIKELKELLSKWVSFAIKEVLKYEKRV